MRPYRALITGLVVFAVLSNALALVIPKVIAYAIDSYTKGGFDLFTTTLEFFAIGVGILIFTYLQSVMQTYASERVARDLRNETAAKISVQDYVYIEEVTPSKLLTNLTSDADAVKTFVSQAIASIVSSLFLIVGASVLLLMINWKLGLVVLLLVPIIGVTFYTVLQRVRKLFTKAQEAVDWLNAVINESILGAALIRVVNAQDVEYKKFTDANTNSKNIGMGILRMFAILIPTITFVASLASLAVLTLGGHFVIVGSMTLGELTAFYSYLAILIFPIIIIGFMSNVIAQASASYARIAAVLNAPVKKDDGVVVAELTGLIDVKDVSVKFGEKYALKDVSFTIKPNTKTAIIGPTAAGKTQLLYILTALTKPETGTVSYDSCDIETYNKQSLHSQVGFVFQDSIIFNLTVRENIAFSTTVTDKDLEKAIETAELHDFVDTLQDGLDTVVSERGSSLSGGQKQRIMLARALALNPKVLLLDDFTARVDQKTEQKIVKNLEANYPDMTLVSVTQKIAPIENYDQIIVLMEGEVLAVGTHAQLLKTSPEYVQIYESQKSTSHYELQA
ncbi:MAG: transporter ATP-binding protein [Candidatus Adlerbacteria bacterium]|nr:transporter ATP-binding protein [Candidatus Adlerbacteria bacterium]